MAIKLISDIEKFVSDGKLACWTCKSPLTLKNIRAVNIDIGQFFYNCDSCGNSCGVRSFKSLGFSSTVNVEALRGKKLPYLVIVNNEVFGDASVAGTPLKVIKIVLTKAAFKVAVKKVDIDTMPLSDEFKTAVKDDIKICGEKRYWIDTATAAAKEGTDIVSYLKKCDEDYKKHNEKYGVTGK